MTRPFPPPLHPLIFSVLVPLPLNWELTEIIINQKFDVRDFTFHWLTTTWDTITLTGGYYVWAQIGGREQQWFNGAIASLEMQLYSDNGNDLSWTVKSSWVTAGRQVRDNSVEIGLYASGLDLEPTTWLGYYSLFPPRQTMYKPANSTA